MRSTHTSIRTGAIAAAAGTLAAVALLTAPSTQAAAPAAPTARTAAGGAVSQPVRHDGAALAGITRALDESARIPGTAWAIDPKAGQVVVSLDQTVTGAKLARLTAVLSRFGDAVRTERVSGAFALSAGGHMGGDAVYSSWGRCVIGFNVRDSNNVYYFLTTAHCGTTGTWYADSGHTTVLGTTVGSSYPGNDYVIVRYAAGIIPPGAVDLYNGSSQDIVSAADPFVGEAVKRSSPLSAVRSGTVTAVNATVNYAEGTVTGLIKTNICPDGAGGSGAPLFDGTKALGLASGGSGNCTSGGTTYFQPVTEPLAVYGVNVY